jgi:hypothetical protein
VSGDFSFPSPCLFLLLIPDAPLNVHSLNRKCAKFVLGKKSAMGDRPAVKREGESTALASAYSAFCPAVDQVLENREELEAQHQRVRVLLPGLGTREH